MPTTRPGYIWSGTEWVEIGQEAVVAPVKYQTSAPTSPSTGDIWIDSDDDVPGIDTSQFLRWRKTMAGGETSLSGTDDNGLTLKYTPNYEQLYINGVLQVRAQDYTATNGTSITGLTALAANDVVEVFGVVARTVGDVYTQAQTNSLLDAKSNVSSTGLVLVNTTTFSAVSSTSINNCFSSAYDNYRIVISGFGSSTNATSMGGLMLRLRVSGTDSSSSYNYGYRYWNFGGSNTIATSGGDSKMRITDFANLESNLVTIDVVSPFLTKRTAFSISGMGWGTDTSQGGDVQGNHGATTSYDGFTVYPNSGTITGTIKVYGYK